MCAQRAPLPEPPEPPDEPELPEEPELPDMPSLELERPDEPLSESDGRLPLDAERSLLLDDERSLLLDDERSLPLDAERSLLELPASPSPWDDDPLVLDEPLMPPLSLPDDPELFWSRSAMFFLPGSMWSFAGAGAQIPLRALVRTICLRIRGASCGLSHGLPRARMRALRWHVMQPRDRRRCLRR